VAGSEYDRTQSKIYGSIAANNIDVFNDEGVYSDGIRALML
jgi:hypothetical protein